MPPSSRSPQPAKAVLALRDIPQAQVALDLGCSAHYLGRVLNGRETPSDDFKQRLADYLELAGDDLFVDDPEDVVVAFVRRTTAASGVPERVEDAATVERVACVLRDAARIGGGRDAVA